MKKAAGAVSLEGVTAHLLMTSQLRCIRATAPPAKEALNARVGVYALTPCSVMLNYYAGKKLAMPEVAKISETSYWKPQLNKLGGWAPSKLTHCAFSGGKVGTVELEGFAECVGNKLGRQLRPKATRTRFRPSREYIFSGDYLWFFRKPQFCSYVDEGLELTGVKGW